VVRPENQDPRADERAGVRIPRSTVDRLEVVDANLPEHAVDLHLRALPRNLDARVDQHEDLVASSRSFFDVESKRDRKRRFDVALDDRLALGWRRLRGALRCARSQEQVASDGAGRRCEEELADQYSGAFLHDCDENKFETNRLDLGSAPSNPEHP